MAQLTSIGWCDATWNPTHGCSIVSSEFIHCYAQTLSLRYRHTLLEWLPENAEQNVLLKPHKLREPLGNAKMWRGVGPAAAAAGFDDGMLVFVNSTSDLFHDRVPTDFVARVFATMMLAHRHTFQILTKRAPRMRGLLNDPEFAELVFAHAAELRSTARSANVGDVHGIWPLPNVWMGVSIGLASFAGRADLLRDTPAAIRMISAEPLIGPLVHGPGWTAAHARRTPLRVHDIDWVIAGGESGPDHRRIDLQWVCDIRDACTAQPATAFFLKQLGGAKPGTTLGDLPADLRCREFPYSPRASRRPARCRPPRPSAGRVVVAASR